MLVDDCKRVVQGGYRIGCDVGSRVMRAGEMGDLVEVHCQSPPSLGLHSRDLDLRLRMMRIRNQCLEREYRLA